MFTMVFKATYEAHGASLCGSVHPFYSPMNLNMAFSKSSRNYGKMCTKKKKRILVYTGWWFKHVQTFFIFHFIYGMSSFPLTFTHIFQIWLKPASSIFWGGRTLNGIFVRERVVSENGTDPDPFHQHCLWVQILDPFDPSFHGWFNTHNVKGAEGPLFWVNYSDLTSRPNPGNHGLF
jgi:hypothetical protein